MKHHKELKKWILENLSLKSGNGISPSKCRRDWFKWNNCQDKLNNILSATAFLGESSKIGLRVYCIINDIHELKVCYCGKVIKNPKNQYCTVKCMTNSDNVIQKKKNTCNERYGGENPIASSEVRDKAQKTLMKKYGVTSYSHTEEHKKMLRGRNVSHVDNQTLWDDEKTFKSFIENDIFNIVECMNFYNVKETVINKKKLKYNITEPNSTTHYSIGHREIVKYIKKLIPDIEIHVNTKQIINPLELDVFLPKYNLAIEFDGVYWHSTEYSGDKKSQLHKTDLCNSLDINLLRVYDLEWSNSKSAWKSIIKSKLGLNEKIYARNCVIRIIDNQTKNDFLNKHHLQKQDIASIRYGLYYNNELVSVMTFCKSRYNKNYDYELSRFASKNGITVVGGASKLETHFRKQNSGSIISYANKRHSNGNLYKKLGFTQIKDSPPSFNYFKSNKMYSRIQFQKHKLFEKLDNFNPNLTAKDNMALNGFKIIYDCGNHVFIKE